MVGGSGILVGISGCWWGRVVGGSGILKPGWRWWDSGGCERGW